MDELDNIWIKKMMANELIKPLTLTKNEYFIIILE